GQPRAIVRLCMVAGGKDDVGGPIAVRERATERGGGGKSGGNSGNRFAADAGLSKSGNLLGRTTEEQRVAAFEADDAASVAGMGDHEDVNLFLSDGFCAAALAYIDNF